MKKKIIIILTLLLVVGLTGCSFNKKESPGQISVKIKITSDELQTMEKISKLAFVTEKESMKVEDYTNEQKEEMARALAPKGYTESTGAEMIAEFQKYFGKQEVTFEDIDCDMQHKSPEEQVLYFFNKETDRYEYNEKHPGHGGGYSNRIGEVTTFDSIEIKDDYLYYNVKILFYGPSSVGDVGAVRHGKGYLSYNDALNQTNPLVDITGNNKYTYNPYGMPAEKIDEVVEDYKNELDTYQFVFEKENGNLVFKEYKKL